MPLGWPRARRKRGAAFTKVSLDTGTTTAPARRLDLSSSLGQRRARLLLSRFGGVRPRLSHARERIPRGPRTRRRWVDDPNVRRETHRERWRSFSFSHGYQRTGVICGEDNRAGRVGEARSCAAVDRLGRGLRPCRDRHRPPVAPRPEAPLGQACAPHAREHPAWDRGREGGPLRPCSSPRSLPRSPPSSRIPPGRPSTCSRRTTSAKVSLFPAFSRNPRAGGRSPTEARGGAASPCRAPRSRSGAVRGGHPA
jgi:hypothetical protein